MKTFACGLSLLVLAMSLGCGGNDSKTSVPDKPDPRPTAGPSAAGPAAGGGAGGATNSAPPPPPVSP